MKLMVFAIVYIITMVLSIHIFAKAYGKDRRFLHIVMGIFFPVVWTIAIMWGIVMVTKRNGTPIDTDKED